MRIMHGVMGTRIVRLETGSPTDRAAYADALERCGLVVADGAPAGDAIVVGLGEDAITVRWSNQQPPARMSRTMAPADLATFLRLAGELAEMQHRMRAFEDAEPAGLAACVVGHDANNLLTPMMVAAEELAFMGSPLVAELARPILEGCVRLRTLVRRLMVRDRGVEPRWVDVNAAVASLVPTLRILVGGTVQLTTRLQDPVPSVLVDPVDLEGLVLNLITNARDAMPGGGAILISTATRRAPPGDANDASEGRWVLLEVRDCGVGMDAATLARAFDPFFSTKGEGRGTGLGLASVRRTVLAASGDVRISSQPGGGTVVQVWLPGCS
jgi:signal transduction histidine kinase